ncbi:MAG: glycerol-3-phosphate dehydrogenase subunit GlpB [Actinomycetaceae bacterium]|nr:glycerol-3-phosphate dehydrogenase subunit GlpB [Actinomycetaceae bacterium]
MKSTVVIGAGIAGLTAALRLRELGHRVTLISKGLGGLQLSQGTIDVLGYHPNRARNPLEVIENGQFPAESPEGKHPYAVIDPKCVRRGVEYIAQVLGEKYLVGDVTKNVILPTAVGAMRPTCLVPPSMKNGDLDLGNRLLIVGIRQLKDFYPQLVADNLSRSELEWGIRPQARAAMIDFEFRPGEVDSSGLVIARALEDPQTLRAFVNTIRPHVEPGETVGLPAVLGVHGEGVWEEVQRQLGHPVFEIPLPPPSVPGMRLNQALTQKVKDARIRFMLGTEVTGVESQGGKVTHVLTDTPGGGRRLAADYVVLAGGGFESGALTMDSYGKVFERALDLPVTGGELPDLIHGDYWGDQQALFRVGVAVDKDMRPLDRAGAVVYENVRVIGGTIAGAMRWQEKSGEGIALASMIAATDSIGGNHE